MFKCCQHAIDDSKVCVGLTLILIKKHRACLNVGTPSQKLKTLMKLKLFQESFYSKKLWSSSTSLHSIMENNMQYHFEVMCQVHRFG